MNCVIGLEGRFCLNNGRPACNLLTYERFWKRYLHVFDEVTVVGRLFEVEDAKAQPIEGPGVHFVPLMAYDGPEGYLRTLKENRRRVQAVESHSSAIIGRVPGPIGSLVIGELAKSKPFGLEVVGDPYDDLAPGSHRHPLRSVLRHLTKVQMQRQCRRAAAVAYVTRYMLQRRYLPSATAFTTNYSSIELPEAAVVTSPRVFEIVPEPLTLVTVGSLATLRKGTDLLIDAVAACRSNGLNLRLVVVGDGQHRAALEARARQLGIGDCIVFTGMLPGGPPIWDQLDKADLFVLPSRGEGLPRSVIEAMARGLPCIATDVSGIPELLEGGEMMPPGDAGALERKIVEVASDPQRLTRLAAENLVKAADYVEPLLQARRNEFYSVLCERTQSWLDRQ